MGDRNRGGQKSVRRYRGLIQAAGTDCARRGGWRRVESILLAIIFGALLPNSFLAPVAHG